MDGKYLNLQSLSNSEMSQINGGGWAYSAGKWWGDRMCNLKALANAYYNYWDCGCYNSGC